MGGSCLILCSSNSLVICDHSGGDSWNRCDLHKVMSSGKHSKKISITKSGCKICLLLNICKMYIAWPYIPLFIFYSLNFFLEAFMSVLIYVALGM